MTVTNGWPARSGVPLHPEKEGWHWVSLLGSDHPQIMEWFSDAMVWADDWTVEACAMHLRYLGPVLLPDEVAKREDIKWHEGYAVGVLDVRRGTAFGEPDPHYAALQARVAKLEEFLRQIEDDCDADCPPSHGYIKYAIRDFLKGYAVLGGKKDE